MLHLAAHAASNPAEKMIPVDAKDPTRPAGCGSQWDRPDGVRSRVSACSQTSTDGELWYLSCHHEASCAPARGECTNGCPYTILCIEVARNAAARLHSTSAVQRIGHDVPDPFCIAFAGAHSRPLWSFPRMSDLALVTGIVEGSRPMLSALRTKTLLQENLNRTHKTTLSMLYDR